MVALQPWAKIAGSIVPVEQKIKLTLPYSKIIIKGLGSVKFIWKEHIYAFFLILPRMYFSVISTTELTVQEFRKSPITETVNWFTFQWIFVRIFQKFILLIIVKLWNLVIPIVPNAPFLYLLKISENFKVFWCFQGVERGCNGNKWGQIKD